MSELEDHAASKTCVTRLEVLPTESSSWRLHSGGVPVIRGGDISNNRIIFNEDEASSSEISNQIQAHILRGGELVLNLIAEPGHSAMVPRTDERLQRF